MKTNGSFLVCGILLTVSLTVVCSDSRNADFSTVSNFDDESEVASDPSVGPGLVQEEEFKDEGEDSKIFIPYTSSISHEETDVEVNIPIKITFDQKIDHRSVTPETFYVKNSNNFILYSRIIRSRRTFTLIPRIPLQPGRTYTAVLRGIKNIYGKEIKTIRISYTNRDLDFGLYWYGKNGLCEKYFPDIKNSFYDDKKSTVIYSHGFEAGITSQIDAYGRRGFKRETFFFKEDNFNNAKQFNGLRIYVNHAWIDSGWNTGMVFWNQFADDYNLFSAESKIWSFDTACGSRYRFLKKNGFGEYRVWDRKIMLRGEEIEVESVADLLGIFLIDSLKNNTSGNLRLVGHSLGGQVVSRLTKMIFDKNMTVERVALLDPAWSRGGKKYLGDHNGNGVKDSVGERCRQILLDTIEKQSDKFAVEIYHVTGINLGIPVVDDNAPLTSKVCDVNILPRYYGVAQLHPKHMVIRHHYFWSYGYPPPIECRQESGVCVRTGVGPSASTSTEDIVSMMTEKYEWKHTEGTYTPDPSDDKFERKKKVSGFWGFP